DDQHLAGFLGWARAFGMTHYAAVYGPDAFADALAIQAEQDNLLYALRVAVDRDDLPTVAAVTAVLAAVWTLASDLSRLVSLVRDTAWVLSHYRPEPSFVEVTRAAAVLSAAAMFQLKGARDAVRSLVVLRRLPAAPPDTVVRAAAQVLVA